MPSSAKRKWSLARTGHAQQDINYLKRHHRAVLQHVKNTPLPDLLKNRDQGDWLDSPFQDVRAIHFWNDKWRLAFALDESDSESPKVVVLGVGLKDGFYASLAERLDELGGEDNGDEEDDGH